MLSSQDMELQEKEEKDEKHTGKLFRKNQKIESYLERTQT